MNAYEIVLTVVLSLMFLAALISPFFVKNPKQRYKWPFKSRKGQRDADTEECTERRAPEDRCEEKPKSPKKHSGKCDGDCANCPPHYGYRHGRWYYGHSHIEGCVFGGNKGDGGRD